MMNRDTMTNIGNKPTPISSPYTETTRSEIAKILKDAPERALHLILEFSRGLLS